MADAQATASREHGMESTSAACQDEGAKNTITWSCLSAVHTHWPACAAF